MAMKRAIKKEWVKALRSGKFEQGKYQLCTVEGKDKYYCCLGVLRKIISSRESYLGGTLNSATLERTGLTRDDQATLLNMNDERNFSFNSIANYIEKYL